MLSDKEFKEHSVFYNPPDNEVIKRFNTLKDGTVVLLTQWFDMDKVDKMLSKKSQTGISEKKIKNLKRVHKIAFAKKEEDPDTYYFLLRLFK